MTTIPVKTPVRKLLMVIYFFGLLLLLGLGIWQIQRGLEKKHIEEMNINNDGNYFSFDQRPDSWDAHIYKLVELKGEWIFGQAFLLDNRIHNGKIGYELFNQFKLESDGSIILVNRGWIAKRYILETSLLQREAEFSGKIRGQLYKPTKGFTLGPAYTNNTTWPKIIQYIDSVLLAEATGTKLEPVIVVLDSNVEQGLVKIWSPHVVSATRHYGYAAQWWGLAITMMIFGVIWFRKQ